jgi:hypoxanthine phosphoribosyltransferase
MKATLVHPSWHQVEKGAAFLSLKIAQDQTFTPTAIIGLARGGLVPAVIMSHLLNVKMFPVSYSSKRGNGEYKEHENVLPEFPITWNILIVDDICDTGYTLREVTEHYHREGHVVRAATLFYKEGAVVQPEFIWQTIPKDANWIEFPWEL